MFESNKELAPSMKIPAETINIETINEVEFKIITPHVILELQADSRKDISEWFSALQVAKQLKQEGVISSQTGVLFITIYELNDISITTEINSLKLLIEMAVLGQKTTTEHMPLTKDQKTLTWNQEFEMVISEESLLGGELIVSVKCQKENGEQQDTLLGEVRIPMSLIQNENHIQWHKLSAKKGNFVSGSVKLGLRLSATSDEVDEAQQQLWSLSNELLEVDDLIFGVGTDNLKSTLCQDP